MIPSQPGPAWARNWNLCQATGWKSNGSKKTHLESVARSVRACQTRSIGLVRSKSNDTVSLMHILGQHGFQTIDPLCPELFIERNPTLNLA